VGPCGVVDVLEFVELGLEFSDGRSGWLGCEPPFLGLVEPLNFALGLGCPGEPFLWRMPSAAKRYSKLFRPPVNREV